MQIKFKVYQASHKELYFILWIVLLIQFPVEAYVLISKHDVDVIRNFIRPSAWISL